MVLPSPTFALSLWEWLTHLRSVGQIVVGIADNSVIPLPGSMDVLTIWLAASEPKYWPYYSFMATVSAVAGGYITYALARQGGKEALERKKRKKKLINIFRRFQRRGFWAIAVPAVLPPPFPIVPFLLAAGAMQYPRKKFVGALALGRGIRFTVIGALGAHYGTPIVGFFSKYYKPALIILISLAVLASIFGLIEYLREKKGSGSGSGETQPKAA